MRTLALVTAGLAATLAACGDGTGPADGATRVSLSFATSQPTGAALSRSFALGANQAVADTVIAGSDTLVITRARVVLREIELKRVQEQNCDTIMGDDDGCEEFETGPVLVDLPLNGLVETSITVDIDTGSYNEIEFEVHKPSDDNAADSVFVRDNPLFADISIRVEGTFNGTAFTYESDLNVDQELRLPETLVITGMAASTNVTMLVDLAAWFRSATGGLVDPATANKGFANENRVKDNIKNSFEAFEDEDRDGDDDSDDDS